MIRPLNRNYVCDYACILDMYVLLLEESNGQSSQMKNTNVIRPINRN